MSRHLLRRRAVDHRLVRFCRADERLVVHMARRRRVPDGVFSSFLDFFLNFSSRAETALLHLTILAPRYLLSLGRRGSGGPKLRLRKLKNLRKAVSSPSPGDAFSRRGFLSKNELVCVWSRQTAKLRHERELATVTLARPLKR